MRTNPFLGDLMKAFFRARAFVKRKNRPLGSHPTPRPIQQWGCPQEGVRIAAQDRDSPGPGQAVLR